MKKWSFLLMGLALLAGVFSCKDKSAKDVSNSMRYRTLGSTGIEVGEVGLGCAAFGYMDSAEAMAFMDVAIDSGVNYIDLYDSDPKVRSNIGYALSGRRDKMVIQGHIGTYWENGQHKRTRDLAETKAGFEDLLARLGTDHIDVGMIHICDKVEEWDELEGSEFLAYVQELKKTGKILHIGMSSHNAEVALKAAKSGLVEVIMFSLNPAFDRLSAGSNVWDPKSYDNMLAGVDPVRIELYDYCAQHNIGITVMKAFGGGGKLLQAETSPLKVALTPVQCLSYCLGKPCVSTVVCGAKTIDELQADLYYLHASDEEKDYSSVLNSSNENVANAQCTYCNHCSPCPKEINIAEVNRLLDKAEQAGGVSAELQKEYDALPHHAGECVQCGACESRCPFDVPIRERMEKAQKIFGK